MHHILYAIEKQWFGTTVSLRQVYIYFYPVHRSVTVLLPKIISSRPQAVNDCAASLRSLPIFV